jgi:hypothetical protein
MTSVIKMVLSIKIRKRKEFSDFDRESRLTIR